MRILDYGMRKGNGHSAWLMEGRKRDEAGQAGRTGRRR